MKYPALSTICILALVFAVGCPPADDTPIENNGNDTNRIEADAGHDVDDADEPIATAIQFSESEFVIERATPTAPDADVVDQNGDIIDGAHIAWSSADDSIIEISSGGFAIGQELGETELIAISGDIEERWPARVVGALATDVSVVPAESTISVGWELPYTANLRDASNLPITDGRAVNWTTTDTAVATIDSDGVVTGVSDGTVEVVASVDGAEGRASLTVTELEIESMDIVPGFSSPLEIGAQLQLTTRYFDLEGNELAGTGGATWASTDDDVASVDDQGLVEAIGVGSTTITATAGELEAFIDLEVIFTIERIAAGGGFTCAVASNRLRCVGENSQGQLADGSFESRSDFADSVFDGDIEVLSLGAEHGCLIDGDSEIWCWGSNHSGQIGQPGGSEPTPQPLDLGIAFQDVSAGLAHTCAVSDDEQVWCWGENADHQLGFSGASTHEPTPMTAGPGFSSVVVGDAHTCAIGVDSSGYCWGNNQRRQLGGGTTDDNSAQPQKVDGGATFSRLSAGAEFTCGISSSGPPVCWGANDRGQLGSGGTNDQGVPLTLAMQAGEGLNAIAVGDIHACGLVSGGSPRCWGAFEDGRLGTSDTDDATEPQPVDDDPTFSQIAVGNAHTCGRTPDQRILCWGAAPANSQSPAQIEF